MRFDLIERYILRAVMPYTALAALLLTLTLLVQQAGKFAELLAGAQAPLVTFEHILAGLLPNILVFALPMATLLGVIIGFGRMNADSELIVMRAAGVASLRLITTAVSFGALMAILTLFIGFDVAPEAARVLRDEAFNIALAKLQSPIQPRSFNTSLPGKVIYVREGDEGRGEWRRVFVFSQDGADSFSVSTARNGRIDATQERSELVLTDVFIETVRGWKENERNDSASITNEHSTQLRLRLKTDAEAVVRKSRERPNEPDELNWSELRRRARADDPAARRAAQIALHKRLTLCIAPLAFAFLGGAFGCAARHRSGRGGNLLIGLAILLAYYLIVLAAEQLARAGALPAYTVWAGVGAALLGGWLALRLDRRGAPLFRRGVRSKSRSERARASAPRRIRSCGLATGLLDRAILRSLALNFMLAFAALIGLIHIFTLFELLRYIAVNAANAKLVARYLIFLTPMLCVSVAPLALLVATIATYSLIVRRSESIAWLATGQSIYRLTLPSLFFALLLSVGVWAAQERVLPFTNRVQDQLRQQIRVQDVARTVTPTGRLWIASADGRRLYAYALPSDAERAAAQVILKPALYELDEQGNSLKRLVRGESGAWEEGGALYFNQADVIEFNGATAVERRHFERARIDGSETPSDFKQTLNNVAYLNARRLSETAGLLKERGATFEAAVYLVALQRRFADLSSPLVVVLLSVPLAFLFGRRGTLVALAVAVIVGLSFWGMVSGFNQLGLYQIVPPVFAAWSPPTIFFAVGAYLLARAKT
jgi:lipopolysaccharide export system permease protein